MRRISYIIITGSCLFLIIYGYFFSYHLKDSTNPQPHKAQQAEEAEHILTPSYLIQISDGNVIIRYPDGSVYETTNISEESLPDAVREKIRKEYRLNSRQELYSFLENYSS